MLPIPTIQASLEADRSKANVVFLIEEMMAQGFDWSVFCSALLAAEKKTAWKMGWLLTHYVERYPAEGSQHQVLIWGILKTTESHSLQRDLWRAFTFVSIEEDLKGEVYDLAVKTMCNTVLSIAGRAHAMQCAYSLSLPFPELRAEMMLLLSDFHREESAALKARARNLMKSLKRKTEE